MMLPYVAWQLKLTIKRRSCDLSRDFRATAYKFRAFLSRNECLGTSWTGSGLTSVDLGRSDQGHLLKNMISARDSAIGTRTLIVTYRWRIGWHNQFDLSVSLKGQIKVISLKNTVSVRDSAIVTSSNNSNQMTLIVTYRSRISWQ